MRLTLALAAGTLFFVASGCAAAADEGVLPFSPGEVEDILRHGPWPPPLSRDASNHVSENRRAAAFGAQLFFDARLSLTGKISCSSCHNEEFGWSDGRARAVGLEVTNRNTKSILNSRFNRWFGWGGASDSLWAASIRPLFEPREMGNAERHVAALVRESPDLACGYRSSFGHPPPADDESLIVGLGKALAAFQGTLVTGRTPFDEFRDALARGDRRAAARYPLAAQRGLRLFIGAGRCNVCHLGPRFTNDEFDKIGIPVRDAEGRFDWGRYDGIKAVQASRFNLLSRYNDDRTRANAISTRHVAVSLEAYGAFAVPGLRNVALTAPYMHDGRVASLRDVVRHYSEIDEIKLHIAVSHPHPEPGEPLPPRPFTSVLRTLNLTELQIDDMVAFLQSLTERTPPQRRPAAKTAACP